MQLIEICDEAGFHTLEERWRALVRDSAADTIFLSWEWVSSWWKSYGFNGNLQILAAIDESGVLRGIAPLLLRTERRYGQSVRTLRFLGDGSNDSEYLDFVIARGFESPVMDLFTQYLRSETARGTVLLLNELPGTSPSLKRLREFAQTDRLLWTEADTPCATVTLPSCWEEYLKELKPRFRTKVRSVLRQLESKPGVRFGFCETPEDIDRLLPVLFDLHTKRWAADGKPGVFRREDKRTFYYSLTPALLRREWLRFSFLEWNGRILACQYGFLYNGTYLHLQEGYEPASDHWNCGIGLRAWTIREFIGAGVREYDFLGGIGRHKTDWGAQAKLSKNVQTARATYRNVIFCRTDQLTLRARGTAAAILPKALLEARRRRLEQRSTAAITESSKGYTPRAALARCYYGFGFPAVLRGFYKKYQLSGNNRWPTLEKRTQTAARILYYHRVNDDNDPFFPAMATRLFDAQMRFVSRNYRVVSLRELLCRFENGGSAEPVVAITFDDGYRDNYVNALPVLQRYGLPATVFLTTGNMDSGEPLWFEQLAGAFRQTTREYIDTEIDIPRRFWFRTETERLASNNGIFSLLRRLTDDERRFWLSEILRALNVPEASAPSHRMLAWDEVRYMKQRGVDFGGHTVNHPFLSKLTRSQALWEVSECKRRIEEETQVPVEHFAYPNGREEDFGEWSKAVVRDAGYRAAVTTIWGVNYRSTDPMELRRGQPWEESMALFAYKMDWYHLRNE